MNKIVEPKENADIKKKIGEKEEEKKIEISDKKLPKGNNIIKEEIKQDKTIIKKALEISEINKNTLEQNIEIKIDNFKKVIN